jgi:hypothetical protein
MGWERNNIKEISMKKFFVVLLVLLVAAFFVTPAFSQGVDPPVGQPAAPSDTSQLEFIAFLVAITGFFKQQFNVTGKAILLVAFAVGIVLWFLPDIELLLPAAASWIEKLLEFIKLFLASVGSFDVVVNVGAKIATATVTKAGDLSTSEVKK